MRSVDSKQLLIVLYVLQTEKKHAVKRQQTDTWRLNSLIYVCQIFHFGIHKSYIILGHIIKNLISKLKKRLLVDCCIQVGLHLEEKIFTAKRFSFTTFTEIVYGVSWEEEWLQYHHKYHKSSILGQDSNLTLLSDTSIGMWK